MKLLSITYSSLMEYLLPDVPSSTFPTPSLLKPSHFSLDTSGVVGLLDGDDAVSAMAALHVYQDRRWLGWYNSPGSFQIAKRLGSFAKSASSSISAGHIPQKDVYLDSTMLSQSDVSKGPKYRAAHSGTVIEETSRLVALFMKECAARDLEEKKVDGRQTQPVRITIANLPDCVRSSEALRTRSRFSSLLLAGIPIVVSVGLCILCATVGDLYASLLILAGIVANGVSCFVLSTINVVFTHPKSAQESPAGDGILGSDKEIVVLKGKEDAVNSITRGEFLLGFSCTRYITLVRSCSILFFIQFFTQLLLVPQASLFGQVMFLVSLGVSALYNAYVSSSDKDKEERKMLFERVLQNPKLVRYTLGTRTSAVVFMLLVLHPQDPTRLLNELLPNNTVVWKHWKKIVLNELGRPSDQILFKGKVDLEGLILSKDEEELLNLLYKDAQHASEGYKSGFKS